MSHSLDRPQPIQPVVRPATEGLSENDIVAIERGDRHLRRWELARRIRNLEVRGIAALVLVEVSADYAAKVEDDWILSSPGAGQTLQVTLWTPSADRRARSLVVKNAGAGTVQVGSTTLMTGAAATFVTNGVGWSVTASLEALGALITSNKTSLVAAINEVAAAASGSPLLNVRKIVADAVLAPGDDVVLCSGPLTLTLYDPAGRSGEHHAIKLLTAAAVTLSPSTGNVEFGPSYVLTARGESITLLTDGIDWFVT